MEEFKVAVLPSGRKVLNGTQDPIVFGWNDEPLVVSPSGVVFLAIGYYCCLAEGDDWTQLFEIQYIPDSQVPELVERIRAQHPGVICLATPDAAAAYPGYLATPWPLMFDPEGRRLTLEPPYPPDLAAPWPAVAGEPERPLMDPHRFRVYPARQQEWWQGMDLLGSEGRAPGE